MPRNSIIRILVTCLPCITGQANESRCCFSLQQIYELYRYQWSYEHTWSRSRSSVKFFLKVSMMNRRVAFRLGITTPLVALAAMWIIFLKLGCSSAWIGYDTRRNCQSVSYQTWKKKLTWSVDTSHSIAASRNNLSEYGIVCSFGLISSRCGSIDDCVALSAAMAASLRALTALGNFDSNLLFVAHISCKCYIL
jgi:hypothetical protein